MDRVRVARTRALVRVMQCHHDEVKLGFCSSIHLTSTSPLPPPLPQCLLHPPPPVSPPPPSTSAPSTPPTCVSSRDTWNHPGMSLVGETDYTSWILDQSQVRAILGLARRYSMVYSRASGSACLRLGIL